jgi:hypothetical protein
MTARRRRPDIKRLAGEIASKATPRQLVVFHAYASDEEKRRLAAELHEAADRLRGYARRLEGKDNG